MVACTMLFGGGVNPVEDRTEARGFARSREMAACLRKELLYSEKRSRDTLFNIVESILTEQTGEHRIVSQLTREAASRAQAQMPPGAEPVRWDVASKTVIKAMTGAGALLRPDGRPVPAGITSQATPVAGLRDGYRDLTEAFLLEVLIERLGDVTVRDHRALAHVLFRQFDPEVPIVDLEDRVVILLARLADRVELRGDRYVARAVRAH
jgi:hypothetical protein